MTEIDAGYKNGVDFAQTNHLFERAYLRELAHNLGAEIQIFVPVEVDIVAQNFEPLFGEGDGVFTRCLALRGRVKYKPLAAEKL